MAKFVIQNRLFDTSKMELIGNVKKWYEYSGYLLQRIYGTGVGREYDCKLYCSEKGNWLLTHEGEGCLTGEAISEDEAKTLLMRFNYKAYSEKYGELEEA